MAAIAVPQAQEFLDSIARPTSDCMTGLVAAMRIAVDRYTREIAPLLVGVDDADTFTVFGGQTIMTKAQLALWVSNMSALLSWYDDTPGRDEVLERPHGNVRMPY